MTTPRARILAAAETSPGLGDAIRFFTTGTRRRILGQAKDLPGTIGDLTAALSRGLTTDFLQPFSGVAVLLEGLDDRAAVERALRKAQLPFRSAEDRVLFVQPSRQHTDLMYGLSVAAPRAFDALKRALDAWGRPPRDVPLAGGRDVAVRTRAQIMGILNVTPDSFSDGGLFLDPRAAIDHGIRLAEEGADLIDVGGESTRPGSEPVEPKEEIERVVPVIEALRTVVAVPISIDTMKADVARAGLDAGASIVNDVSAGRTDRDMLPLIAERGVPLVLMHMRGEPRTMQENPAYRDVVGEVYAFLAERTEAAVAAGIDRARIIVDPGFGFGKTREHNLILLRRLREFTCLGYPVLAGTSRKSFIGLTLDLPVDERLEGTAASVAMAVANGAAILRVHDVRAMRRVASMVEAVRGATNPGGS